MENLQNKVIVITGANGGMGVEIVKKLSKSGAKFALCSNNGKGLEDLAGCIQHASDVFTKVVDVTVEQEVADFFKAVRERFGKADCLLNLAGLSIVSNIWDTEESVYDTIMDVNVKGSFLMCKHFIPLANQDAICKIINISSMAAKKANGNAPLYCTAKAAVNMLSDAMAIQLKDKNIQVTTLNPAATDTAFWGDRPVAKDKFMKAADIAEIVDFILRFNSKVVFREIQFESFL